MTQKHFLIKTGYLIAVLAAVLTLTGCGSKTDVNSESQKTEVESFQERMDVTQVRELSTDRQLQLLSSKKEEWLVAEEMDTWGYAVTDLNQNGRLELVASECHGTGFYSTTRIFEVNEAGDALVECSNGFGEYDSQPDFLFQEEYQTFYTDGVYYLLTEDMVKEDAATYHYFCKAVCLKNGALECDTLGHRTESYRLTGTDTELIVSFFDGENNEISEEEYYSLTDSACAKEQKCMVKIGWCRDIPLDEQNESDIHAMLAASYDTFIIK